MSWIGSAESEWKQQLGFSALQKVEELENLVEKLKKEKLQKVTQIDVLEQSLEKQKRKVEEEIRQNKSLSKELENLGNSFQDRSRGKGDNSGFRSSGADDSNLKVNDQDSKNRQSGSHLSSKTFNSTSQDDFWSHFGSSRRESSFQSPFKGVAVKKAMKTSEENPFKAPLITTKGEFVPTTPKQNASSSISITPDLDKNNDIKNLEDQLASYKKQIEEMKSVCDGSSSLVSVPSENGGNGKIIEGLKEEVAVYKNKGEEAESKLELSNNRLIALQSELSCQRYNNEAARQQLEKKKNQREQELLAEAALVKEDFCNLELRLKEMEKKINQKETLALANQNHLQSSLDKALAKLSTTEKEKAYQITSYNQIESQLRTLEKTEEDLNKIVSQLKNEKEMHSSQAECLKVKHSSAENRLNVATSRLEVIEQQVLNQKNDLEQINEEKSLIIKERDSYKKDLQENQRKQIDVEVTAITKKFSIDIEEVKRKANLSLEEMKYEKNNEVSELTMKIDECEKKMSDLERSESKAKQEKLQCELSLWETENKLEALKESEEKLKKDLDNCKLKLKCAEDSNIEKEIEMSSMGKNIENLQTSCKASDLKRIKIQSEFNQKEEKLSNMSDLYDEVKGNYEDATVKIKEQEIAIINLTVDSKETIETLSKQAENAILRDAERNSTLETLSKQYQSEITHLSEMKCALDKETESLKEDVANMENDVKGLKEQIAINNCEYEESLSKAESCIVEKDACIQNLIDKNNSQNIQISTLEDDNSKISEQKIHIEGNHDKLIALNNCLEISLSQKTDLVSKMEDETSILKSSNDKLIRDLADTAADFNKQLEEFNHVIQKKESISQELASLNLKNIELNVDIKTATDLLDAEKRNNLDDLKNIKKCFSTAMRDSENNYNVNMGNILAKHEFLLNRLNSIQDTTSKLENQCSIQIVNDELIEQIQEKNELVKMLQVDIAKYSLQCQEKDLTIENLKKDLIMGSKKCLMLEKDLDVLTADLQAASKKLTEAQAIVSEERANSSDRIHSLSQNMSCLKGELAEKDLELKDIHKQNKQLQTNINQENENLKREVNGKLELQNEYDFYRDAIKVMNTHTQGSNDTADCNIQALKDEVQQLKSSIHLKTKRITKEQNINSNLSSEIKNCKKTNDAHKEKCSSLLVLKEKLQQQFSDLKSESESNKVMCMANTVALRRLEDMLQKFFDKFSCHIFEGDHLQLDIIEACEENFHNEILCDMESIVETILHNENPLHNKKILRNNEILLSSISDLTDNLKCLEETLETVLKEKKDIEEKCQQFHIHKDEVEKVLSDQKQIEESQIKIRDGLLKDIHQAESKNALLIDNIVSVENELHDRDEAVFKLKSSESEMSQNLIRMTNHSSDLLNSLQQLQKSHFVAEEKIQSIQLERDQLMNKVSNYLQDEKSMVQKIGILSEDGEEKSKHMAEQQILIGSLQDEISQGLFSSDELCQKISFFFERILSKFTTFVTDNNLYAKNDANGFMDSMESFRKSVVVVREMKTSAVIICPTAQYSELFINLEKIVANLTDSVAIKEAQFTIEITRLTQKITILNENLNNLKSNNDCLLASNKLYESTYKELEEKCSVENLQVSTIVDKYVALKREFDSQVQLLDSFRVAIRSLEYELGNIGEKYELTHAGLQKDKCEVEESLKQNFDLISDMKCRIESQNEKIQNLQKIIDIGEQEKTQLEDQVKDFLTGQKSLMYKIDKLNLENNSKDSENIDNKKIISGLTNDVNRSISVCTYMKEQIKEFKVKMKSFAKINEDLHITIEKLNKNISTIYNNKDEIITPLRQSDQHLVEFFAEKAKVNTDLKCDAVTSKTYDIKFLDNLPDLSKTIKLLFKEKELLKESIDQCEKFKRTENEKNSFLTENIERSPALSCDISFCQFECNNYKEEIAEMKTEIASFCDRIDESKVLIEKLQTSLDKANERNEKIASDLADSTKALDYQRINYEDIIDKFNKQASKIDAREEELVELVRDAKANIKALEGKLSLSFKTIHKLEKENVKCQSDINKLKDDRKLNHVKVKEGERYVQQKEESAQNLKRITEEFKILYQDEVKKVSLKEEEMEKIIKKHEALERSNIDSKSRMTQMRKTQTNLEQEVAKLRNRNAALRVNEQKCRIESNPTVEIPQSKRSYYKENKPISIVNCLTKEKIAEILKRPLNDGEDANQRHKAVKIEYSNLEGLPHKIIQGLNNIPEGNESPGIIRRPTTPLKFNEPKDIVARKPLEVIDTNSPVKSTNYKETGELSRKKSRRGRNLDKEQRDECKTQ